MIKINLLENVANFFHNFWKNNLLHLNLFQGDEFCGISRFKILFVHFTDLWDLFLEGPNLFHNTYMNI